MPSNPPDPIAVYRPLPRNRQERRAMKAARESNMLRVHVRTSTWRA